MKKRMLIAFALIALLATSAFAADFGWGGAFRSVWAVDTASDNNWAGLQFGVLSANAKLDDNNTVTMVMEYADNGTPHDADVAKFSQSYINIMIETANLKTDIFGALGLDLPVTLALNNGWGRVNIHDRFNGVGTGWDPEIFKGVGSLDKGWGRYAYMGFDMGIMDLVNVRAYVGTATFNEDGVNLLVEAWAPIAIADIMTLDIGVWFLNNGQASNIVLGYRVKADMSFGMVGLGVWLGGTVENNAHATVAAQKEQTTLKFVEAVNANFAFTDAMSLKIGAWVMEETKIGGTVADTDHKITMAFDLAFNYAAFTVYGGIATTDINLQGNEKVNGRWDVGVGYGFGATSLRLGVTGYLLNDPLAAGYATPPGMDGLAITGAFAGGGNYGGNKGGASILGTDNNGKTGAALYFMAGVFF
jgi:hypothetical protein